MFFFLLALGAYRWYALKPRIDRYLAVASLYALGLMAKPQIVTFPCVLLLWDYWPLQRMFAPKDESSGTVEAPGFSPANLASPSTRALAPEVAELPGAALPARSLTWLIVEKLPLFGLSAASALLTLKAQASTGALTTVFNSFPFSIRLENAIVSYVRYIGKALWPAHLAVYYPHPETLLNPWQVAGAAVLLLTITALVIAGRHRRYLLVGWFWFLGTLIPMIGLVQVGAQAMGDRYAYLSFIGLFIMICWGVADFQPSPRRADSAWTTEEGHTSSAWLGIACFAMLLALAAVAHQQLWYWRDTFSLWEHAADVTQNNWMAEDMLGGATLEMGKPDQALAHYYRAL